MDNNKNRKFFKKSRSSICKNQGCCGCNSFKRQFEKKNINMEEIDNQILSTEKEITELLDELSKYICPSQFGNLGITHNDVFSQLPNTTLSTDNESATIPLDNNNT